MILNDDQVNERLNSVSNLVGRMKKLEQDKTIIDDSNARPELTYLPEKTQIPELIPSLPSRNDNDNKSDDVTNLVEELHRKSMKYVVGKKAFSVLDQTLNLLEDNIYQLENPKDLSRIANDMSKIIAATEDKTEDKATKNNVIIYRPVIHAESHYQQIAVNE